MKITRVMRVVAGVHRPVYARHIWFNLEWDSPELGHWERCSSVYYDLSGDITEAEALVQIEREARRVSTTLLCSAWQSGEGNTCKRHARVWVRYDDTNARYQYRLCCHQCAEEILKEDSRARRFETAT